MLTTLLESRSRRVRDNRGTAASVTLHAAIIFAAVYATATGPLAKFEPVSPSRLVWTRPVSPSTTDQPRPMEGLVFSHRLPANAATSVDVPTSTPSIDIPLAPVSPELSQNASSSATAPASVGDTGNAGRRAYDVSEVETAVSMIGNTMPEYPSALRSSGIEGKVVAEFVVTESGRADVSSLRIISSTNEQFVESIRRALSRMRFRPAMIGGHAVAQLVQQQFVFKLD